MERPARNARLPGVIRTPDAERPALAGLPGVAGRFRRAPAGRRSHVRRARFRAGQVAADRRLDLGDIPVCLGCPSHARAGVVHQWLGGSGKPHPVGTGPGRQPSRAACPPPRSPQPAAHRSALLRLGGAAGSTSGWISPGFPKAAVGLVPF